MESDFRLDHAGAHNAEQPGLSGRWEQFEKLRNTILLTSMLFIKGSSIFIRL
jgi:hypothetical protein